MRSHTHNEEEIAADRGEPSITHTNDWTSLADDGRGLIFPRLMLNVWSGPICPRAI